MKEYEYSFEVRNLEPYIKYCLDKGYQLIEETNQSRILCPNNEGTMARITIKESAGKIIKQLDFKDDILTDDILIERRETLPLVFEDDHVVDSILEFLNYKKDKLLLRKRKVFKLQGVTFELDEYESPSKTFVVAIEGIKEEVDIVYTEVTKIINE